MKIIRFQFVNAAASIDSAPRMIIKPQMVAETDVRDAKVDLTYKIEEEDVNVVIVNPEKDEVVDGFSDSFRKQITFDQTTTGKRKNFTLIVTAKLGNSSRRARLNLTYN